METVGVGTTSRELDVQSANLSLVEEYLHWCTHKRGRSAETVRAYGTTLRKLAEWSEVLVTDLTVEDMEAFVSRPREQAWRSTPDAPRAAATQRQSTAILRSFFRWMWERNYTAQHSANGLHGPTVKNTNPRPIPDRDWLRLWGLTYRRKGGRPYLDARATALLGLGFFCGLRRAEMLDLRAEQWDAGSGRLLDFTRKGGGEHTLDVVGLLHVFEDRLPHLLVGADLTSALDELADAGGRMLDYVSTSAVGRELRLLCKAAGVPSYTPHQLRHSTATNLLRAGVPLHLVQTVMNHSSPVVTMRYVRAGASELREWLGRDSDGGHS